MARSPYLRIGVLLAIIRVVGAYETGSIIGKVVDPNGVSLPSPDVRVTGPVAAERQYEVIGDDRGRFKLDNVQQGAYTVTISVAGFEKAIEDVRVAPGQQLDVGTVRLRVGSCNTPGVICDDFGLSVYNDPVHAKGSIEVPQLCAVDIDEGKSFCTIDLDGRGKIPPIRDAESDFWVKIGGKGEVEIAPRNGVTLALNPSSEWSRAGCAAATYSSEEVRIDGLPSGSRVCILTNRGRYAQVVFPDLIPLRAANVKLTFVTWQGKEDIPPLQLSPRK